jgi:hypothetical protein
MPSPGNPPKTVVDRSAIDKQKKIPACIAAMDAMVTTAAGSAAVTSSPTCNVALAAAASRVVTAKASLNAYNVALKAVSTARAALVKDYHTCRKSAGTFMTCVDELAVGDATVITQAGCTGRLESPGTQPLEKVTQLRTKPWRLSAEARLQWAAVPGAANYLVELNMTPQNPAGAYVAAGNPSPRLTRVVTGATPGAQLLARVAAIHPDGTQGEWCDSILVVTRM